MLLIPILSLDTATRSSRQHHFYDRWITTLMSPLQLGLSYLLDGGTNFIQNYITLRHARSQQLALLKENQLLQSEIARLKLQESENERLRTLLDFREANSLETLVARVVALDVSSDFRAIRINRGSNDGVEKGMAVLTHLGVVGRILRTDAWTSDVVTILDLQFAIDSINERSRARGVVEGASEDHCQMKFTLRTDDIQLGDRLISSGLGGIFPKGIPVGTVTEVNKQLFGISQEVEVKPAVDFRKLEEVLIVTKKTAEPLPKLAPKAEGAGKKS
jgi:rod shape-determining protein MreC